MLESSYIFRNGLLDGLVLPFFSIEEFIPLLRERMNVLNAHVRQFLVGWITVLDSVPDIDMLGFLPDFLDGRWSEKSFPFEELFKFSLTIFCF